MLSRFTLRYNPQPSLPALRTDKKRKKLACGSHQLRPDVAKKTSSLCDARITPHEQRGKERLLN